MKNLFKAPPGVSMTAPPAVSDPASETETASGGSAPRPDRHQLVRTAPNPDPGCDYVVRFELETTPSFAVGPLEFVVHYVPDKLVLDPTCLGDYLFALTQPEWSTLESLALAMRDDLVNELIPRWMEIAVSPAEASLETARHSVLLEDRQPHWDNPNLLARLNAL